MTKPSDDKEGADSSGSESGGGAAQIHAKHSLSANTSQHNRSRLAEMEQEEKRINYDLTVSSLLNTGLFMQVANPSQELYAGVALDIISENEVSIGIAIHDGTYSIDFGIHTISGLSKTKEKRGKAISDLIYEKLDSYKHEACCKLMGVGLAPNVHIESPALASRLWTGLDIVPFVMQVGIDLNNQQLEEIRGEKGWSVDEKADSMVRKCIL